MHYFSLGMLKHCAVCLKWIKALPGGYEPDMLSPGLRTISFPASPMKIKAILLEEQWFENFHSLQIFSSVESIYINFYAHKGSDHVEDRDSYLLQLLPSKQAFHSGMLAVTKRAYLDSNLKKETYPFIFYKHWREIKTVRKPKELWKE